MADHIIPLTLAKPDKEYIISHISSDINASGVLSGYGIFPGSMIKLIFSSPSKDPCAYEIMGTVIAFRQELAKKIFIFPFNTKS